MPDKEVWIPKPKELVDFSPEGDGNYQPGTVLGVEPMEDDPMT